MPRRKAKGSYFRTSQELVKNVEQLDLYRRQMVLPLLNMV